MEQHSLKNKGWFIGAFMEHPANKNNDVEIKYWELPKGSSDHPKKVSKTFECTVIIKGKTKAVIDDEEILLQAGDYVAIPPNTPNNVVLDIIEDCTGLTIKAPSNPDAKKVIE